MTDGGNREPPRGFLSRLSRISSSGRFIPEIDGLRFVAIAGVVLHHVACFIIQKTGTTPHDPLYNFVGQGFFGVDLFFVISGFILALPFAESHLDGTSRGSLGRYYGRRLTRLEPPYAINLLVLFLWLILRGHHTAAELWRHLVASLFYVHAPVFHRGSVINPAAWSLEIEVQFYLLAPLLCQVFRVRNIAARRALLVTVMLLFSAGNWYIAEKPLFVSQSLPGYLHYFLLGILLADWYLVEGARGFTKSLLWDAIGLVAWAALGLGLIKAGTPRTALLPAILIAYMAAFRGRIANAIFSFPLLTTIGGMCYTIYLYHNLFIDEVGLWSWSLYRPQLPFWGNFLVQLAVMGLPILLGCTILFALIERPCMRPRWWKR
jgi:peptidoglycan/LPS O-acetylase OafA/YrhL